MDANQFLSIYMSAYTSQNREEREKNTLMLNNLMTQQPIQFSLLSCSCINNSSLPITARKLIMTGLTKALRPNKAEGAIKSIWFSLDESAREGLKNMGFNTLIDPDDTLKHSAGNFIAALFVLDLKDKRAWPQILPSLTDNVKNDDMNIQKAAIITLGYICENLFVDNYTELSNEDVDTLLGGICMGMETYNELSKTRVMSFGYSISFLVEKLNNEKEESLRDYVFDILVKLLMDAYRHQDTEVIIPTISALEEVSNVTYKYLGKYCNIVFEKIIDCYLLQNNRLIITINEYFKTLLETEKSMNLKYFENYWKKLAEYCLKALLNIDESSDEEEGGLSLISSFFLLLSSINSVYISQTQIDLKNFITEYLEKDDYKMKYVALIVFESILESSPQESISDFINSNFGALMNFISVGSSKIKKQTLRFMTKVAEFHDQIIMLDQNFIKIAQKFTMILNMQDDSEKTMEIKTLVLKTLENLAKNRDESKKQDDENVNKLRGYVDTFFEAIFKSLNKNLNTQYINDSFSCIFCFLTKICPLDSLAEFYKHFQMMMIQSAKSFQNLEIQITYIEAFLISLTTILSKVENSNNVNFKITNNTEEFLKQGYLFIGDFCKEIQDIPDQALYYMALILRYNPPYFEQEVPNFLNSFVTPSLQTPSKSGLFQNGIDALTIIIKTFPEQSKNYVMNIIPHFLGFLKNADFDRDLNKHIFYAFGDIAFFFQDYLKNYLEELFQIINFASEAILVFMNSGIRSNVEYASKLTEAVLHLIICIIYGFYLSNKYEDLDPLIEANFCNFILFLENFCKLKSEPDYELVQEIVGLMIDFYHKKKQQNFLKQDFLQNLLMCLKSADQTQELLDFQNYINEILKN